MTYGCRYCGWRPASVGSQLPLEKLVGVHESGHESERKIIRAQNHKTTETESSDWRTEHGIFMNGIRLGRELERQELLRARLR